MTRGYESCNRCARAAIEHRDRELGQILSQFDPGRTRSRPFMVRRFAKWLATAMSGHLRTPQRPTAKRVSGLTRSRVQISPPPPSQGETPLPNELREGRFRSLPVGSGRISRPDGPLAGSPAWLNVTLRRDKRRADLFGWCCPGSVTRAGGAGVRHDLRTNHHQRRHVAESVHATAGWGTRNRKP